MIPDTVTNARYDEIYSDPPGDFYPHLFVTIDGVTFIIQPEQKLIDKYGVVSFSGETFEAILESEKYVAIINLELQPGIFERRQYLGATTDPRVVALARRFSYDLQNQLFRPGKRLDIQ